MQESQDLIDEMEEFHTLLTTLSEKDWNTPTLFMDWTPWDVVAHLHYFDLVSMAALEGEESFAATQKELMDSIVSGRTNAEIADRLTLSIFTVKNHVSSVLMKLHVQTRTEAASVILRSQNSRRGN